MRLNLIRRLRRFRKKDDGNMTVEFAMLFPLYMFMMFSGAELALVSLHHVMLDQALDRTVRDIRLGTGQSFEYDDVKSTLCERATFIADCDENLRLELLPQDPREGMASLGNPQCVDRREDIDPKDELTHLTSGQSDQLMIMRACVKIDPIFPTSGMGKRLADNPDGQYALFATTAFVQEPQ